MNYYVQNDFETALAYYLKSLKIEEQLENKAGLLVSYANLALVSQKIKKFGEMAPLPKMLSRQ